jgi:hypothetical protein
MRLFGVGLMAAGAMLLATTAQAQDAAKAAADTPFAASAAIDAGSLATITGKADVAMAVRAQNSSTVSGNSVSGDSQTGAISFDPQTFQNLSGLSLLSANTGNNVSINSSLNVNVSIHP